ncbi:hypothetical protein ElyMa_002501600 [Elysia marginata]|uniref:Uncharacterized protein n=1 Tax=Elysia marginata TaxID=1093978 RepID=A0AAV4GQE7_9GAST|nr:hypothetical protein ElyMa_002501600 [Elysia marginata]
MERTATLLTATEEEEWGKATKNANFKVSSVTDQYLLLKINDRNKKRNNFSNIIINNNNNSNKNNSDSNNNNNNNNNNNSDPPSQQLKCVTCPARPLLCAMLTRPVLSQCNVLTPLVDAMLAHPLG